MVAPTWITPGCVQFLENKKRFHTAWVKSDSSAVCEPLPVLNPTPDMSLHCIN